MAAVATKLTYDDYLQFPDDGLRHELIDGEHAVTPAPSHRHQRLVNNLAFLLTGHLKETEGGELLTAPIDVRLSNVDVVQPDLLVLTTRRLSALSKSGIVGGPPDLIVEVLSPATRQRDETLKRKLYERFGVSEYWLVDPEAEAIRVLKADQGEGGRYLEVGLFHRAESFESTLFPGLSISYDGIS